MVKKGRRVGGILSIVGGGLLLSAAIMLLLAANILYTLLGTSSSLNPNTTLIRVIYTCSSGALCLVGGILALKDKNIGGILSLIGGILGTVGLFIPMGSVASGPLLIPVPLTYTFIFIDPFLALGGGIAAIASGSEFS